MYSLSIYRSVRTTKEPTHATSDEQSSDLFLTERCVRDGCPIQIDETEKQCNAHADKQNLVHLSRRLIGIDKVDEAT